MEMGIFDKLKKKNSPKTYPNEHSEEERKLIQEMREIGKEVKIDMTTIQQNAEQFPNDQMYQNVVNTEEFHYRNLALSYSMSGELVECIDCCNKGLKINENSLYLLYMRGRTYSDLGNLEEGVNDLVKAISMNENFAEAWHELGRIHHKNNFDMDNAILAYGKAYDLEPENFEIYQRDPTTGKILPGLVPESTMTLNKNGVKIVMEFLENNQNEVEVILDGYFALRCHTKFLEAYMVPPKDIKFDLNSNSESIALEWCERLSNSLSNGEIQNRLIHDKNIVTIDTYDSEEKIWHSAIIISLNLK